jgi:hypothetical protein
MLQRARRASTLARRHGDEARSEKVVSTSMGIVPVLYMLKKWGIY